MARRRNLESENSLELLLDTVCNVFGGIIFVAVLIAVLTSNRSEEVDSHSEAQLQSARAQRRADSIKARISELERAIEEIRKTDSVLRTNEASRAELIIQVIDERKEEAKQRIAAAADWLSRFGDLQDQATEELSRRLSRAKAEMQRQEDNTAQVRNAKTIQGRLPFERRTTKNQILVIVTGGRAFVMPTGPASKRLLQVGTGKDIEIQQAGNGIIVTPITGAGILIDANLDNHEHFRDLLGVLKATDDFFDLFVTADSAQHFAILRNAVTSRGFSYNVHPTASVNGKFLFGQADSVSVQ